MCVCVYRENVYENKIVRIGREERAQRRFARIFFKFLLESDFLKAKCLFTDRV